MSKKYKFLLFPLLFITIITTSCNRKALFDINYVDNTFTVKDFNKINLSKSYLITISNRDTTYFNNIIYRFLKHEDLSEKLRNIAVLSSHSSDTSYPTTTLGSFFIDKHENKFEFSKDTNYILLFLETISNIDKKRRKKYFILIDVKMEKKSTIQYKIK